MSPQGVNSVAVDRLLVGRPAHAGQPKTLAESVHHGWQSSAVVVVASGQLTSHQMAVADKHCFHNHPAQVIRTGIPAAARACAQKTPAHAKDQACEKGPAQRCATLSWMGRRTARCM